MSAPDARDAARPLAGDLQQRPYQAAGTQYLRSRNRALLADEAGLGKTNQLIMAAEGRTLVVSPAMLEDVWVGQDERDPGEIMRWRPDLLEQGLVTWTSYSSLCDRGADVRGRMSKVLDRPRPEFAGPYDTVIFDEAHYLKGRKTNWVLAAEKIKTERMYLATGTPLVNWAHEIWMPLRFMFPGETGSGQRLGSYWRWVANWFNVSASKWDPNAREIGDLLPGWTWEEFMTGNRLHEVWLRRWRDDVLSDLPPLTEQVIHVKMNAEQAKVYKRLKKDLYAQIEETGHEIVSWSTGGVWTKLLKLTTGIEVEDPTFKGRGAKLQALMDLMPDRAGKQTLVFCLFRNSAEATARMLTEAGMSVGVITGAYTSDTRKEIAREFRLGQYDVLVGTIGAMSEGLTFTGADTVVFLERDPRPSKNEQAVRRIHRYGQENPCLSINLVTEGTVDVGLMKLVSEKTDQQMAALRAFDLAAMI